MAADGRATIDNQVFTEKTAKITKLSSGGLFGAAGAYDTRSVCKLFDNVKTAKSLPDIKALRDCNIDFRAILVLPNGSVFLVECGPDYIDAEGVQQKGVWQAYITEINDPYICCGSGARWAKGALDFGANADQAVRIAMKNDVYSGGKVQVIKLETKQPKKVVKS